MSFRYVFYIFLQLKGYKVTTHTLTHNEAYNSDKIFRTQSYLSVCYPLTKIPMMFLHMQLEEKNVSVITNSAA